MEPDENLLQSGNSVEKVDMSSFSMINIIGEGSYSKVLLVRKINNGKLYAMKSIKKSSLKKDRQVNNILIERHILANNDCQFLVKMDYAFQDDKKLYFLLKYCAGGELFNLLQQRRRLSENDARFYAAQILLALQHLHDRDIIYRDLKPENVIIDWQGFIKLTDFGLSKLNITSETKAFSICGTTEYLAPEIVSELGHGKAVDFWTVGCIIFEMVTGLPPFMSKDPMVLFKLIREWHPTIPENLSADLKSLLDGLFIKQPEKRLGSQHGVDQILSHPWFQTLHIQGLIDRTLTTPFIPHLSSEADVRNFDTEFTDQKMSPSEGRFISPTPSQNNNVHMKDFSYQNSSISTFQHQHPEVMKHSLSPLSSGFQSMADSDAGEFFMVESGSLDRQFQSKNKIE